MRTENKYICLLVLGFAISGCLGDTAGISPPGDKFIFPVGVASVNDDAHLLVVNSNFDLQYNAGTLVAYDLSVLDSATYNPDTGVYTISGSLDGFCGSTTAAYCSLDAADGIDSSETIRLGAYASDLDVTPAGDRALIPVRGEQAIIAVDIAPSGDVLSCGEGADLKCDGDHRVEGTDALGFPIEPYNVRTMDFTYDDGGTQVTETLGFATHRAGGQVSLFSVSRKSGNTPAVFDNRLIRVIGGVVEGASGLAVNPRTLDIYVSGQRDPNPHVAVLKVLTDLEGGGSYLSDPWFSQGATISISQQLYAGTDARQIAVSPDGNWGFVIVQSPPALLKMDLNRYEVTDMVTVCPESSQVKVYEDVGDPDDPFDNKLYAFVLCFLTGQVYVIDVDYMTPVVRRTGEGPQDIAFDDTRKLAYIVNFSESTVSLMQAVPPFNQVRVQNPADADDLRILRIGEPDLPKGY